MTSWFSTATRFRDPVGAKRIAQYVDLLDRFPAGHLVDLGAGHGIFSRIAVARGWRVTAVDARDGRFPDDPAVRWVKADIRDFDEYGDVDLVVNLGLWYHLALNDQRELARRIAPRPLILDTHIAVESLPAYQHPNRACFSELELHDGAYGRLYDESKFQDRATASFGNLSSFWPTAASLHTQLYEAGYEVVEQVGPPYLPDRGFWVARNLTPTASALDEIVAEHNPVTAPDAAATTAAPLSLIPELAPVPATPRSKTTAPKPATPKLPPVRVAASLLVASVRRSAAQRLASRRGR